MSDKPDFEFSFSEKLQYLLKFFASKKFWLNLLFILLTLLLLFLLCFQALKVYTNHNEKIRLPQYVGEPLEEVKEDAHDRSFKIVIQDSTFIVGKPGGLVLSQDPMPESFVKEGRKIYLTITKYQADKIPMSQLPRLYGENFDIKSQELKIGYQIESEIVDRAFDPGPENHILAVLKDRDTIITDNYRNNEIEVEKGGRLAFVISEHKGGSVPLPDLRCMSYAEANFLLSTFDIKLEVLNSGDAPSLDQYWILSQEPAFEAGRNITMGSIVKVEVAATEPVDCVESE